MGERLALASFAQTYPELNVVHSGPIRNPDELSISGSAIVVKFDSIDDGLVTSDGLAPGPFMIAGFRRRLLPGDGDHFKLKRQRQRGGQQFVVGARPNIRAVLLGLLSDLQSF